MVDIVALAAAVTELLNHTRRARTALWCAVQMSSAECVAESSSRDPTACRHATSFVTDNWHSPLRATEPFDATPHRK